MLGNFQWLYVFYHSYQYLLKRKSLNCLNNDGIEYLGDLVNKDENDMLRTPNFGRKSLNELKSILSQYNLKFGMDIEWPMKNQNDLILEASFE